METNSAYWFKASDLDLAREVFAYTKWLSQDQSYKQLENFKNMRLYGQNDLLTARLYPFARTDNNSASIQNRVTLNIVQSMIDTVTSKITKNKPKPTFITDGGDFKQQRRARRLTQFVEGQFQACDFYAQSAIAFLDSCIFGTGAIKIFRKGKEIVAERIFIDELVIDDRESLYGKPRQMHQKKYIHKDVLKAEFPDFAGAIDAQASTNSDPYGLQRGSYSSDMILTIESWRLPSSKKAKDGKHSICIENQTLDSEDYDRPDFPFVFWRWGTRPIGFFGQGLAEQLTGLQIEINKILRTIQISMHLVSIPKIYVEAGSKVVSAHLNNQIGGIIKFTGSPPTNGPLGSIPPELFAHLDRLYQRAYEIAGISQLSAQSQIPQGLSGSGKSMRVYNDLETERFMSVAQRYEHSFLDASRHMISLAKEIAKDDPSYSVQAKDRNFLRSIKWKDVDLEEDTYVMHIYPASALSSDPAGRLADVQELIQAGFVGKEDGLRLLDLPDLQSFYNFSTASAEDIMMTIEHFLDEGTYRTPEPFQNLAYGQEKMQQALLYYGAQGADEDTLELFRRWIQDAQTLTTKATTEAASQTFQAQAATQSGAEHSAMMQGEPLDAAPSDTSQEPQVDPNMPPPALQ